MPKTSDLSLPIPIAWRLLDFDPRNPRLQEASVPADADQLTIAIALWQKLDADEIVMSILAAEQFFQHEPLMVEACANGRYAVIEGNRRLLAVRVIADRKFRRDVGAQTFEGLETVSPALLKGLEELPCIVTTREALWQFVGFKHVNGAQPWSAISKAEFIAHVHEKQKIGLTEIARQIGDRHRTVKRLYQGWCVLRQAEKSGVFDRENRTETRFAFSHLYTILELENTKRFLGLPAEPEYENTKPIVKSRLGELGELMRWLFGNREPAPARPPLVNSQNPDLRHLETALAKESGIRALRAGLSLSVARNASLGDKWLFDDAMTRAISALKEANGVCATGAQGDRLELDQANDAYNLAGRIVDEVESKQRGEKRRGVRSKAHV
jgi:hypothetical protein